MKKHSIRVLVSEECNYSCDYCCNHFMRTEFTPIDPRELATTIQKYACLVISGGEPLMDENIEATIALAEMGQRLGKSVIVYTNLSFLPPPELLPLVDGFTVGFHPSETDLFTFAARFLSLVKLAEGKSIRCNVEKTLEGIEILAAIIRESHIYPYTLNDCSREEIEDIFILENFDEP